MARKGKNLQAAVAAMADAGPDVSMGAPAGCDGGGLPQVAGDEFPATLGACADELYDLRARRLAVEAQADELKHAETRLKEHLARALEAQGMTAVSGHAARASLTTQQVGAINDWDALTAHVRATGDFTLFQRRLNDGALRERWAEGEAVPGVNPFPVTKVNLTKAK